MTKFSDVKWAAVQSKAALGIRRCSLLSVRWCLKSTRDLSDPELTHVAKSGFVNE